MRSSPKVFIRVLLWLTVLGIGCGSTAAAAPGDRNDALAKVRVSGLGWWANREMRFALERLLGDERGATLNANAVEDVAFLLASMLNDEGFLSPVITVQVDPETATKSTYRIDSDLDVSLPRDLQAKEVRFEIARGERSYVETVEISGLASMPVETGELFFKPGGGLISPKSGRAYSTSRLRRSAERLREELRQRGYAEARVEATGPEDEIPGGPIAVPVRVEEGPLWVASELRFEGVDPGALELTTNWSGQPWTPVLHQNLAEDIRQTYYANGYADVSVRLRAEPQPARDGQRNVTVVGRIEPGPQVRVGEIRFEGNEHTEDTLLRRRIRTVPGDLLNPVALERARYRLSRLGVFDSVGLRYEPPEGETRTAIYELQETGRRRASLLAGYGSYEQLRGGVEFRQTNLFGRAHHSRLELIQSMKSSRGEYTYSVPEILGESIDGSARLFYLEREEVAFIRQEYGGTVTLKRPVPWFNAEGSVGYTYQSLRNQDNELTTRVADERQVTVASMEFGLTRDARDSQLRPRRGYRWSSRIEAADTALGGEVKYERIEVGGSYHTSMGRTRWVHVGLSHGVLTTLGASARPIPVNKRFFPGGDSSIRGYMDGEAAPRGEDGLFIGAKTYLLVNLELEQAITDSWSAVVFLDSLGIAAKLADYPFSEQLYSAGLGVRYQTLIGPIRLEYGRNLNPRPYDHSGTLHLSIGFPF